MNVVDRFLNYVKIDTQSDPRFSTYPSTEKQKDLGALLKQELIELNCRDVEMDEHGVVYATIASNVDYPCDTIGLIAHMDTAPDFSGTNVNPRIIKDYDGKDIVLNSDTIMKASEFESLLEVIHQDLIVTDGKTLLGADDKAGIAEIMAMIQTLNENPSIPHGTIKIAFTCDEEIGAGVDCFDVAKFNADYAYTMDGGEVNAVSYETFNAASCTVEIQGLNIHPGSAKNKMLNALNIAMEFHQCLPVSMRPEYTEGAEGFNHLNEMSGNVDHATLAYIIRNHDLNLMNKQKALFVDAQVFINKKYGRECITLTMQDSYYNMKEILKDKMDIVELPVQAIKKIGLTPVYQSVRGGTDGSRLTFMGLPCPNIGTGGRNYHGRYEYCVIQEMFQAVDLLIEMVQLVSKQSK